MFYLKFMEYLSISGYRRQYLLNSETKRLWNIAAFETRNCFYEYWIFF